MVLSKICSALQFEKSSNMPKIWQQNKEKPCVQLALIPFLHGIPKNPGYRAPDQSLILQTFFSRNIPRVKDMLEQNIFYQKQDSLV